MTESVRQFLRHLVVAETSLTEGERQGLAAICDLGSLVALRIQEPLLLTAAASAAFLGLSEDAFLRARREHVTALEPLEVSRNHLRWSKFQLTAFAAKLSPVRSNQLETAIHPNSWMAQKSTSHEAGRGLSTCHS